MQEISVTIFKRSRCKFIQMQYRDPTTGNKVVRSTGKTTTREAEREASKWEEEILDGRDHRRGRITWEAFRERYQDEVLAGLARQTDKKVSGVFSVFERLAKPERLASVTTELLTRYAKQLRAKGRSESTIKGHLAHLGAALSWARSVKLLAIAPELPKIQRAKGSKVMKGRPITYEELERMLKKTRGETDRKTAKGWRRLLVGLWWSGLRLGEALQLHWTDANKLRVDLSLRHPMLRIPAELEKGNRDRLLPMAPEFARFLLCVPAHKRTGYVFEGLAQRHRSDRISEQQAGRTLSAIGKAAGVVVEPHHGTPATDDRPASDDYKPAKFASAHDLRRSFGERWASRVMPQVLMELMRHESVETTLRYYVGRNAQNTASLLWEAHHAVANQTKTRSTGTSCSAPDSSATVQTSGISSLG